MVLILILPNLARSITTWIILLYILKDYGIYLRRTNPGIFSSKGCHLKDKRLNYKTDINLVTICFFLCSKNVADKSSTTYSWSEVDLKFCECMYLYNFESIRTYGVSIFLKLCIQIQWVTKNKSTLLPHTYVNNEFSESCISQ